MVDLSDTLKEYFADTIGQYFKSPRFIVKRFAGIETAAYVHRRRHDGSFDASCGLAPETPYVALYVTNRMMPGYEYHLVSELDKLRPEALLEDMSTGWGHSRLLSEVDKKTPEYQQALAQATAVLHEIKQAVARPAPNRGSPSTNGQRL